MPTTNDDLSAVFSALADPTRRGILARLAQGPATVKELSASYGVSGPAVSKHLRVLQRAGLVRSGREAQWRPRSLNATPLKEVADFVAEFRRFWDGTYGRLDAHPRKLKERESADDHAG